MSQRRYKALALAVLAAFTANAVGDWLTVTVFGLEIVGIAAVASVASFGFFVATLALALQIPRRALSNMAEVKGGPRGDTTKLVELKRQLTDRLRV
jgi:hypothetical protein